MGRWGIWLLEGLPGTTVQERCKSIRDSRRWVDEGYGYLKDYQVQQYMRDARVREILEGGYMGDMIT